MFVPSPAILELITSVFVSYYFKEFKVYVFTFEIRLNLFVLIDSFLQMLFPRLQIISVLSVQACKTYLFKWQWYMKHFLFNLSLALCNFYYPTSISVHFQSLLLESYDSLFKYISHHNDSNLWANTKYT